MKNEAKSFFYTDRVAVLYLKYFMELRRTADSRLEITGGVEGLFLKDVLEKLGREYRLVVPEDHELGRLGPNGSWTGLVGMVQRGEADLASGFITVTEQRNKAVDFSIPYRNLPPSFAIGKPKQRLLKNAFLLPFKVEVWVCIFLVSSSL